MTNDNSPACLRFRNVVRELDAIGTGVERRAVGARILPFHFNALGASSMKAGTKSAMIAASLLLA
ncbi:MAG: hypothetical protein ACLP8B_18500, partial [Xanthobacteraceae bacterium]